MTDYSSTRRGFLTALMATASGCATLGPNEGAPDIEKGNPTPTETSTPTDTPTKTETSTPENHPGTFLVDFTPAVDEEVRNLLQNYYQEIKRRPEAGIEGLAEWYIGHGIDEDQAQEMAENQMNDILEREEPEFTKPQPNTLTEAYSTEETYDNIKFDGSAFEYWSNNNYFNLGTVPSKGMMPFVETLDDDQYFKEAREWVKVPLGEPFRFEKFSTTDNFKDAFDLLHWYLRRYEQLADDSSISTEDEEYGPMMQEAFEQYTDFETHFWEVNVGFGTHGNGMVWNQQEDALRLVSPMTGQDVKIHPLIEDSKYFNPDEAPYWHPLRFADEYQDYNTKRYKNTRSEAGNAFYSVSNSSEDTVDHRNFGVGLTTGYLVDVIDKLRYYNQNDTDFQEIKQQSDAYSKLVLDPDDYVMAGTVEDPYTVRIEDPAILEAVRNDQEGRYNNMKNVAEEAENIEGPVTLDDVNQILDGQNTATASG